MAGFREQFLAGTFRGVLTWENLDALWEKINSDAETRWYGYTVEEAPPTEPSTPEALRQFVAEVDGVLRKLHHFDHCGIVYVDDPEEPSTVLIYHPHRIGGCGSENGRTIPGWTLSLLPPEDINPPPPAKAGLWNRLLAKN